MKEPKEPEVRKCPSCGTPRLGFAWDCGKCGLVFDDETGSEATRAEPGTTRSGGSPGGRSLRGRGARHGKSVGRKSSSGTAFGGLAAMREWVAANKAVAVIISFVIYIGVVWLFSVVIVGATNSPGAIKESYRDITGRPLPKGFGPTMAAHFVSRKLVVLNRIDQVILILYKEKDRNTDGGLRFVVEGALDLFEIPWEEVRTRKATVGGTPVEVPVLQLWGEGGPHMYLVPTSTSDGGRAIEAVIGAPSSAFDVVEEMVKNR